MGGEAVNLKYREDESNKMAKTRLTCPCLLLSCLELKNDSREGRLQIVIAINGTKYSLTIVVRGPGRRED